MGAAFGRTVLIDAAFGRNVAYWCNSHVALGGVGVSEGEPEVVIVKTLRRLVADRTKYTVALVVVLGSAIVFIVLAVLVRQGIAQDLMVNVGSTALGVFLTAIVLEPLVEQARRPEETIHHGFPHEEFIAGVARASQRIRIMGAWPYVMDHPWRESFLGACRRALARGVPVHVLVLDPLSYAAEQRRHDLDNQIDVSSIISETLSALQRFRNSLAADLAGLLEIRVYSSLPPARLYAWDQRAMCSFFPMGSNVGTDVRHYETNVTSGLARFVCEQFDTVWRDVETRDLEEYLYLPLSVQPGSTEQAARRHVVQHVTHEGEVFAASVDLVVDLLRTEQKTEEPTFLVADAWQTRHRFEIVASDDPLGSQVSTAFQKKYGSASATRSGLDVMVRLLPEAPVEARVEPPIAGISQRPGLITGTDA